MVSQKELIDTCNLYDGQCEYCRGSECLKRACNTFIGRYETKPFLEDVYHPQLYTEAVIYD